ncbi:hypothetical protein V1291_005496 [Nitrobacteraceae bacterium AZCC 1564]
MNEFEMLWHEADCSATRSFDGNAKLIFERLVIRKSIGASIALLTDEAKFLPML